MVDAFKALQQIADVVESEARPQCAKVTGLDHERLARGGSGPLGKPCPKRVIHDVAKRPAAAPRPRLQLGGHIVIEGQRRTHIMMLTIRHHDVNAGAWHRQRGSSTSGCRAGARASARGTYVE